MTEDSESEFESTRCGFVAVVGAPNAGKSTLVNALVGAKVSIVSPRVQTTRTLVRGIAMFGAAQVVFVDTPGIFQPKKRFERAMVAAAWAGAADAEIVLLVVDAVKASKPGGEEDTDRIVADLKASNRKALLALNKVDLADKGKLLELAQRLNATGVFTEIFMVSALTGDGLERIREALAGMVPSGPWLFPDDEVTDMPSRLLAAEVTREKLFLNLKQELPYSCAVETERWEEKQDGSLRVEQVIYVTRESHRPIVLGNGGQRIKTIGASARRELEEMFDRRVHLFLHVKVNERWNEDRSLYAAWGLDFNA
ncbi:MAG: GTPase Era [Proteobacteria bacterium]|nr:GTPase Era [Pseudomonadota bacterium]